MPDHVAIGHGSKFLFWRAFLRRAGIHLVGKRSNPFSRLSSFDHSKCEAYYECMTPVCRCLQRVDHASAITDTTVIGHVSDALNELEDAYHQSSERIVALEEVLQTVSRQRVGGTPFGRFVRVSIERRQNKLARCA